MSRCFPFPPPGYEKKARTDEVDLLKKEKHREKKHKKDKKDKEKKESKEKREKEGKDGKHKEKKDKKEKHRDKKKDKDKDKDKEKEKSRDRDRDKNKISTADDKGIPGQAEVANAGKPLQKEIKQNDKKDSLFENKLAKQHPGNNGEKAREHNHLSENKDSKFLLELDRRTKGDDGGVGNQLAQKFSNADRRKDEGTVRLVSKNSGTWPDGNEKLKDKGLDARKVDGKGMQPEVRPTANATVQNHAENVRPKVDAMPILLDKGFERNLEAAVERKEKVKEKKNGGKDKVKEKKDEGREKVKEKKDEGKEKVKEKKDDKRGDKRKDREKEKKGHGKDKDRDKEKKKEEKVKEHTETKTTEQNKLKESNNIGTIGSNSITRVPRNSHENAVSGENLKKRKDIESNGVPRGNDNWPNKFPKTSYSLPYPENGRILEPCQVSPPNASVRPGVAATTTTTTGVRVENKECKINGVIEGRPFAVSSNKTHVASMPAVLVTEVPPKPPHPDTKNLSQVYSIPKLEDLLNEASVKPPHPDTKYLSQVYSVPKVEEWSDFDDQEWLLGSSTPRERKLAVESSEVGEIPQVWAEALHIEPADVIALPYAVPY